MSDDSVPTAAPQKKGGGKDAANDPVSGGYRKAQQQLKPTQTSERKRPRLTVSQGLELAGVLILVFWLWPEFISSHEIVGLCLWAAALSFAHGGVCNFLPNLLSVLWGLSV